MNVQQGYWTLTMVNMTLNIHYVLKIGKGIIYFSVDHGLLL